MTIVLTKVNSFPASNCLLDKCMLLLLTVELISVKSNINIHEIASLIWNPACVHSLVVRLESSVTADLDQTWVLNTTYADIEGITKLVGDVSPITSYELSNTTLC